HWLTSTAERIASMIMGQPFVERTQRLGELKQIDPTMYALVRKEMRDLFTKAHGRSLDDLDNLVKHLTKLGDKYGAFAHVAILPRLDRWLVCPNCKVKTTVKRFMTHVTHAFRWKDFDFCGVCPDCDYTGKFTREDRPDESQFDYVCML
ncbi:MAG: hypothetical protein GTO63_27150, partial [Anaerolineae bacterium]|nr:hypothetical protein [Anaerolineae bacterium]NIN98414.1 hypothetical protein [Anaerolineae bacterium]NIQ80731.1 hypothetical protein [Anaerolineae bacterium]